MSYADCVCGRDYGHAGPCRCAEVGCLAPAGHAGPHRFLCHNPPAIDDTPTPRETPAAMAAITPREELLWLAKCAGDDETLVLLFLARRIVTLGQQQYGRLDLRNDTRDLEREAIEEDADAVIYRACDRIRAKLRKG